MVKRNKEGKEGRKKKKKNKRKTLYIPTYFTLIGNRRLYDSVQFTCKL